VARDDRHCGWTGGEYLARTRADTRTAPNLANARAPLKIMLANRNNTIPHAPIIRPLPRWRMDLFSPLISHGFSSAQWGMGDTLRAGGRGPACAALSARHVGKHNAESAVWTYVVHAYENRGHGAQRNLYAAPGFVPILEFCVAYGTSSKRVPASASPPLSVVPKRSPAESVTMLLAGSEPSAQFWSVQNV
jgi:hypothetical protein